MLKTDKKLPNRPGQNPMIEDNGSQAASLEILRNMRILLADDMPTNVILMRAILEHGGFTNILTADNGKKALEYVEANTRNDVCGIDLILLDIIMPSADGFYVCRKMQSRKEWQHVPIIMITSENKWREETARASFDSGATDIMFKPVRSIELIPRVISALIQKYERDNRLRKEQSLRQQLDEYRLSEERLNYLVSHDDLTGLYNRRWLIQALELTLAHSKNSEKDSALLYVDIDKYRQFNSYNGSKQGDQLLIDIAEKIKDIIPADTFFARIANDEFGLLLENTHAEAATGLAKQLMQACADIQIDDIDGRRPLTISIGINIITSKNTSSGGEIIAQAEQACYTAKHTDGDSIHLSVD